MEGSRGFTIIEALVIAAIVVVFLSIVILHFASTKAQFALSRAAHTFAQMVRRAQDMALASVPYKDPGGTPQVISGYGVYVDIGSLGGNKHYIIYADHASPGNQQYDALDYVVETINIDATEKEIIIKQVDNVVGNKASFNFNTANLATTITQSSQSSALVVFAIATDTTKTRAVLVNTSGLIEVQ